jgi:hypothetical protein
MAVSLPVIFFAFWWILFDCGSPWNNCDPASHEIVPVLAFSLFVIGFIISILSVTLERTDRGPSGVATGKLREREVSPWGLELSGIMFLLFGLIIVIEGFLVPPYVWNYFLMGVPFLVVGFALIGWGVAKEWRTNPPFGNLHGRWNVVPPILLFPMWLTGMFLMLVSSLLILATTTYLAPPVIDSCYSCTVRGLWVSDYAYDVLLIALGVFVLGLGMAIFAAYARPGRSPQTTPSKGTVPPIARTALGGGTSHGKVMIVWMLVLLVFSAPWLTLEAESGLSGSCTGDCGLPITIGMVGGIPAPTTCGATASAMYHEGVSITSTSGSVSTNTFGLKVIPIEGGSDVPNVAPPVNGSACPTSGGFFVVLESAAGLVVACWTGGQAWSSPASDACPTLVGASLGVPVALTGGMTAVVYMYGASVVPPMAGAYTMQAYGLGGATVSGSVDL